jgi:hypothetical protein
MHKQASSHCFFRKLIDYKPYSVFFFGPGISVVGCHPSPQKRNITPTRKHRELGGRDVLQSLVNDVLQKLF